MKIYNCLVVGAGPAGLAYASSLNDKSGTLIVDAGKSVENRSRNDPKECILGTGGAGLFSDGKFSFYPSGTKIWEQDEVDLREAYAQLKRDLSPYHSIPSFPEIDGSDKCQADEAGWKLKPYKSIYLSLEDRIKLIQKLAGRCLKIRGDSEVLGFKKVGNHYEVQLNNETILTKKIVLAGGRFMPTYLDCEKRFMRYEFGMRVEFPAHLLKKPKDLVDPKFVIEKDGVECRTFCWCQKGEVVATRFKDFETYSGRADCEPTNRSNFGFNIRVKDPALLDQKTFQELSKTQKYTERLSDISKVLSRFPTSLRKSVESGLTSLKERFPELDHKEVFVIGPTIEGVGEYPLTDKQFRLESDPNISVIGDCSGLYRGIVASMLSGYILANRHNKQRSQS